MSKANSRGWRQVLARNPSAKALNDPNRVSERSATKVVSRRRPLERRDPTAYDDEAQFTALRKSIALIEISQERALRLGRKEKVADLSTLLANQKARADMIAQRMAKRSLEEPTPIDADGQRIRMRPDGQPAKVLLDLTAEPMKYVHTGPTFKRFERSYANKGNIIRPKIDLSALTVEKKGKDGEFHRVP